ncbi:unnamed protein product [Staurois parvus]|uniref:Uncharacterized protein n=1 Tax=Staurois parvus TaxID=386267 RepID=A0ABN9CUB8_9NEOB|nr:unnamed protein product [Staurois parvus]
MVRQILTPKHNFSTLTCVSKTVNLIATALCIQVDYTLLCFQDKLGFHLVVNGNGYLLIFLL